VRNSIHLVIAIMFVSQIRTFADTNQAAISPIPKPLAVLATQINSANSIIVSNWADTMFGQLPFTITVPSNEVSKVIQAISLATFVANQEHPDWEYGWKMMFYRGTNLLTGIYCNGGSFLTDGVWSDESGVLGKICGKAHNDQYRARVYGDEDKDFNESRKVEAKAWLNSPLHSIRGEDKKKVLKFVNQFYGAGAKKVYIAGIETHFNGKNPPTETGQFILVVLPQDEEARQKFFIAHWEAVQAWGFDAEDDIGQKYTWYPIDWSDIK